MLVVNKNVIKLVGLLCAFIYFSVWNWVKDVEGYSYSVGAMSMFIYFMIKSFGDENE